jgi:hypothetical protein
MGAAITLGEAACLDGHSQDGRADSAFGQQLPQV